MTEDHFGGIPGEEGDLVSHFQRLVNHQDAGFAKEGKIRLIEHARDGS